MSHTEERWELVVTVPTVSVYIEQLVVSCGDTTMTVRLSRDTDQWCAWMGGHAYTTPRGTHEEAVEDARRLVTHLERRRRLYQAVDHAAGSTTDPTDDPAGDSADADLAEEVPA